MTEAKELLDQVLSTTPTDDPTLQAMTMCYRDMNEPAMVSLIYENAVKKITSNKEPGHSAHMEEVLSHLFMSYVRVGDFHKQQITANNLFKVSNKNPYFFWSVMSTYLQGISSPDKESLLLTLAEKKVDKMINEGNIDAEAEIQLYLMILERQKKYERMLQVLDSPLGRLIPNNMDFVSRKKAFLLKSMNESVQAFLMFKSLVENNPDQLEYYHEIVSLAIELDTKNEESKGTKYTHQVVDILKKFTEKSPRKSKLRGPHLAKMTLNYRLREEKDLETLFESSCSMKGSEMLTDYFLYFGHKACLYQDMTYLWHHHPLVRSDIQDFVQNHVKLDMNDPPTDEDSMRRHMNVLWLRSMVKLSEEPDLQFINYLLKVYSECLHFGKDRPIASIMNPSDGYAELAAHLLLESQDENLLIVVVHILYGVMKESPANHTVKLVLILVLNRLGCSHWSFLIFQTLDAKYIMSDSLQYIINGSLASHGLFTDLSATVTSASSFYSSTCKDSNDLTINCYKFGSFHKIEEILQLKERLLNSVQFHSTTVEKNTLDILTRIKSLEQVKEVIQGFKIPRINRDKISDNRDVRVFSNVPLRMQLLLDQWQKWSLFWLASKVHFIGLIQELLFLITDAKTQEVANGASEDASQIDSKITQLEQLVSNLKQFKTEANSPKGVYGPETPRFNSFLEDGFVATLVEVIHVTLSAVRSGDDSDNWSPLEKRFKSHSDRIAESLNNSIPAIEMSAVLAGVVNFVELLGNSIAFFSFVKEKQQQIKNKKKSVHPLFSSSWPSFISSLESETVRIIKSVSILNVKLPEPEALEVITVNHDLWTSSRETIYEQMRLSIDTSKEDLISVLKTQVSLLSKLK